MTHLHDVHHIKRRNSDVGGGFGEYLRKYFPIPKCCCGCGREVSLHRRDFSYSLFAKDCKGINRARNPTCIEFYLHQGMDVDDAIIALSNRQRNTAKKHSTAELRELLRECNSGDKNPSSYKSIIRRTGKPKLKIERELSERSKGDKNGFANRIHTAETMVRIAKARSQQSKVVTKPELVMWGWLHALDIEFERECQIDCYVVDFIFSNVMIEVYGDYWHSDRMSNNGVVINKTGKDETKNELFESLGYVVNVFWESEIMKTPKIAFQRLKDIVDENKINRKN